MIARVWNALVRRAWYAAGCPSRFPLRRVDTRPGWSRADLVAVAILGALIGLWISPGRAYADPVADTPGGAYVSRVSQYPVGPGITVTLSDSTGHRIRTAVLRPCRVEDGRRCYWQADRRGNGIGSDYVVVSGRVFRMDLSWISNTQRSAS